METLLQNAKGKKTSVCILLRKQSKTHSGEKSKVQQQLDSCSADRFRPIRSLRNLALLQRAQNFPSKCSKTSSSVGGLCCAAITGFLGWKYLCYKRSVWPTLRVVCVAYTSSVGKPKPSPVTDLPPHPSILSPVLSSTGVNHYHRRDRFTMGGSATVAYQKPPWEMFWPTARAQRWLGLGWLGDRFKIRRSAPHQSSLQAARGNISTVGRLGGTSWKQDFLLHVTIIMGENNSKK